MIHLRVESKKPNNQKRKKKKAQIQRTSIDGCQRQVVGMNQLGERDQKVQISNYTINMS